MKYFSVAIFFIALTYASCAQFGYEGYRVEESEDFFSDIMGDDLTVGALVPLSGHASHVGRIVRASFMKSSQDLSRSCKGSCRAPRVRSYNTHSNPASAVQGFKEMYEEGVRVFIGLVTSAEAEAVAKHASMYAKDAILISPTSTATNLCKYKQLYRLSMDDRGYAQVLFDLAFDAKTKNARELPIQMVLRNDAHGKGLFNDVHQKFENKDGFKVLNPIFYDTDQVLTSSHFGQLVNHLNASLARHERSMIVFSGYGEVEGIIQTAAKNPNLLRHLWLLSDSLTLSKIETPQNVDIFGLSFAGNYDSESDTKKEEHKLRHYLCSKGLPLTKHALLAYDAIIVAHNYLIRKSFSSFQDGKTFTGAIKFSSCNERASGSYAFAIAPREKKIDNLLVKVIMNKWIIRSYYNVKQNEREILASQYEELNNEAKIEADLQSSTKKSITATDPPVIEIKKKDLLEVLVDIGDKRCTQTAQLTTTSIEVLDKTCSQTKLSYKVMEMPEAIIFSDQLGFSMEVTCSSANYVHTLTRVCPSSKSPDTELVCTDKVSSKAIGKVEVEDACTGSKIGTGVCYTGAAGCWVSTFFTWGVTAPACSAATAGCSAVSAGSYLACN
ncbi:PREDICTED: uncharacterized protein LOC109583448 [Amphimedon queenslandica]|uniref:Leucine-binding protein domain-containing protein n=1 Tax=Amphimedon queenslandica TaxID=400682 RepID=A0A1X7UFZ2_AMPQE|nr:PREDICTED: uncharacterized protein LOC109583448 [Amphimedon queenslandica]|eukprot:XP_019854361.1 PREDICTED: uncharacterized protein LOC109583448 [Amphimedon queenslandica]